MKRTYKSSAAAELIKCSQVTVSKLARDAGLGEIVGKTLWLSAAEVEQIRGLFSGGVGKHGSGGTVVRRRVAAELRKMAKRIERGE